jgi:hypothetical protein
MMKQSIFDSYLCSLLLLLLVFWIKLVAAWRETTPLFAREQGKGCLRDLILGCRDMTRSPSSVSRSEPEADHAVVCHADDGGVGTQALAHTRSHSNSSRKKMNRSFFRRRTPVSWLHYFRRHTTKYNGALVGRGAPLHDGQRAWCAERAQP